MRNKKGSHVGMILSFLVFVTFLAFLYSVIEPATRSQEDKLDLMEFLKVELIEEFTADLSTVIFDVPASGLCVQFNTESGLGGKKVVAKDKDDNIYDSHFDDDHTYVDYSGGILKLYYSDEFNASEDIGNCGEIFGYEISLFKTTEEVFESKILSFSEYLEDNYETFKQEKGMGVGNEFGFVFNDGDKNFVTGTDDRDVSTDVYVQEFPIQYMDSEANIKPGFLNIKVW